MASWRRLLLRLPSRVLTFSPPWTWHTFIPWLGLLCSGYFASASTLASLKDKSLGAGNLAWLETGRYGFRGKLTRAEKIRYRREEAKCLMTGMSGTASQLHVACAARYRDRSRLRALNQDTNGITGMPRGQLTLWQDSVFKITSKNASLGYWSLGWGRGKKLILPYKENIKNLI